MSYLPPVLARLQMRTDEFDAAIDRAKEKLDSLNKSFTDAIRVKVDDSALRRIAQDTEALHRLAGRQAVEGIKVQGYAETALKLDAIDEKMNRLNGKTARMNVKVNKSDLDQAEGLLSKMGSLFGGGHSFNLPFTNMTANPIGLTAIIAGIAVLLPELAGVVAGFAAAGAGAAAFAALAAPAVKHVTTAYSNLKAARLAYSQAQAKEQLDPSKTNASALRKAADNLKLVQETIGKMPAAEQAAITGISNLGAAFGKQSKAFEPKVFEVFSSGLRLAATLLPTITPFASTFADSLAKIFSNLNKSAQGKGFQDFLKGFHGIEGPAIQAIAAGIGNVAGSVGRLLTVMSGKDVAHTLNIAFSAISGTIGGLTTTIRFLMNLWDGMGIAAHTVAGDFDTIRHSVAGVGHDVAHEFDVIRHTIAEFSPSALISKFAGIGHKIASGFDGVRHDIAAKFDGVKSAVVAKFAGAGAWLADKAHAIANAFDHVRHDIAAWFNGVKAAVVAKFAGAAGWLVSTGANVLQGLINGLLSKIPGLQSVVNTVVGILKSVGHAVGVKSPSTLFDYYGRMIGLGLAQGIQSQNSRVQLAANGLVGMVTSPAAGAAGGHGSAGGEIVNHVHVHLNGREIYSEVQRQAVSTQRRTGQTGLTKRTR